MKAFTEPMSELKEFGDLWEAQKKQTGMIQVSGCIDAAKPQLIYSLNDGRESRIIVTFQEQRAKELVEAYRFFDRKAAYYPAKDILFYQSDIRGNVLTAERIQALKLMAEEQSCTIITTFDGLMNPMPSPEKNVLWRFRRLSGILRSSVMRKMCRCRQAANIPCAAASLMSFR